MTINMTRAYHDDHQTVSQLTIEGTPFRCFALEPTFCDYQTTFPGASNYCLPTGQYQCKPLPTELSPMTLTVMKAPAHRSCRFIHSPYSQPRHNSVILCENIILPEEPEDTIQTQNSLQAWQHFQHHIYQAFTHQQQIILNITNQIPSV